ncbi:hypothetical protein V8E52_000876 [Russula decolorans]
MWQRVTNHFRSRRLSAILLQAIYTSIVDATYASSFPSRHRTKPNLPEMSEISILPYVALNKFVGTLYLNWVYLLWNPDYF